MAQQSKRDSLESIYGRYRESSRADRRLFQNLFQHSRNLGRQVRHGSRLRRQYEAPQSPSGASWPGSLCIVRPDRDDVTEATKKCF